MKILRIRVEDNEKTEKIFSDDAVTPNLISINGPRIFKSEIEHIPVDEVPSQDYVINNLLKFFYARSLNEMIIDIDKWDSYYHVEELTIEEIEARLGHRIKIVDNK